MAQFERWADQLEGKHPQTASGLRILAGTAREEEVPEDFWLPQTSKAPNHVITPKYYPEIPENEEYDRQAGLAVNFADKLGINETACLKLLPPRFSRKLKVYDDLYVTRPLLTPRFPVSWIEAVDAAGFGVSDYLREHLGAMEDWKDPREQTVPKLPRAVWIQDGTQFKYRKPVDVRSELQNNNKYQKLLAGEKWVSFNLALLRADMVANMGWDVIGTSVGAGSVLYLGGWGDRLRFGCNWVDFAGPGFRALVRGR